jgi:hypothetical protein
MVDFITGEILAQKINVKLAHIERILGISRGLLSDNGYLLRPETQALLKLIYHMPWLLEVAERSFDPEIAALILQREAINAKIKILEDK